MQQLKGLLASTYALYLKTQNFHWHIEGSDFFELHELFGAQYNILANDIDKIAEMIRILGEKAPATFRELIEHNKIEDSENNLSPKQMVQNLIEDYKSILTIIANTIDALPSSEIGLKQELSELYAKYQKNNWMLESWSK